MILNIGELKPNTKQPKTIDGKIPYHNEINETNVNPKDGLCVFCGVTSLNLMIIDLDDLSLIDDFKDYLDKTFVVKSGKKGYHVYFRTYENPKSRSLTNDKGQHIDILGQGKIAVLPPSIHIDTKKPYEIISDNKIKQLTRTEEEGLFQKLQDLGFVISEKEKSVRELHSEDFVKTEGQNRGVDLLRVVDSWKIKNPELTESILFLMANQFNIDHFDPPYSEDKVQAIVKQGSEFGEKIISERENQPIEEKENGIELEDKAIELLQQHDKKEVLEKLKEHSISVGDKKGDTILKQVIKKAAYKITNQFNDEEESATLQAYNVGSSKIIKAVKSENDNEQIVIQTLIHEKPQWIDVNSPTFNQIVRIGTQEKYKEIYNDNIYTTSIKNLHAESLLNGTDVRPIFNRCALIDGKLYYDLQNVEGTIYEVSKDGIIECQNNDDIPIFLKSSSPQPKPLFDDDKALDELIKLFRIEKEDEFIFKSHLICYFLTGFPIPIAIFHGEQGSAKTSTTSGIKQVHDPEGECALSIPEKVDDLAVVLSNHGTSSFDNTDNFSKEISQFLCKAVTGTQHVKRQLYSNGEEFSLKLKSKIILNGISPSINQPDLLERSIFYELPPISRTERMTDKKFQEKLTELKPKVLGVIFNVLQKAMTIYDDVNTELDGKSLPRMASFSVWGEAISRSLGHENNVFIKRYNEKLEASDIGLTDEYPIIQPFIEYMGADESKEISISSLFNVIVDVEKAKNDDRIPKDKIRLGKQLRQLSPALRTLGFNVEILTYNKKDGKYPRGSRYIRITKISENGLDDHID